MASPKSNVVFCQNDEEINQQKTSSDDEDTEDYFDLSAALTVDETSDTSFIVHPVGCCEFDETQLISANSSKAIQKCILRLSNEPCKPENYCWAQSPAEPIYMKFMEDQLQFTALNSRALLKNQPLSGIKSWAVDDDNTFAFVVESESSAVNGADDLDDFDSDQPVPVELALLKEPSLTCYVFRSMDDDEMSYKIASKLNEEFNRRREQMLSNMARSKRLQQAASESTVVKGGEEASELEEMDRANSELSLEVKYVGSTRVPRPSGIDILNIAIDKCFADAQPEAGKNPATSYQDAKIHISPSSIIVEDLATGEIIVECRVRYLTFMGISKRDIRWLGFIMQNSLTRHFEAHCFQCDPSAGQLCEAIQQSCSNMYEKILKNARQPETLNIIPKRSKLRDTFVKTFSRIKLRG